MKQILTLALLCISALSYAQGSNGLVGHWPFNGNTNDVSGNGLNGTTAGTTSVPGYNGLANNALSFNGTSSHVTVADNALLDIDSFSICALIKPTGIYTGPCQGNAILWRGGHTDPHLYSLYFSDNPFDSGNCSASDTNKFNFAVEAHGSPVQPISVFHDTGSYIHTGEWICVVSTYNNDTIRIYVEGNEVSKMYWPDQYVPGMDDLLIGATQIVNYPYRFTGVIDDIRLYSRPLSFGEVNKYCDTVKQTTASVPDRELGNFSFGPNPASDRIKIEPGNEAVPYSITLLNSLGQTVGISAGLRGINSIDIDHLPAGLYFIRFAQEGVLFTERFLKN